MAAWNASRDRDAEDVRRSDLVTGPLTFEARDDVGTTALYLDEADSAYVGACLELYRDDDDREPLTLYLDHEQLLALSVVARNLATHARRLADEQAGIDRG